VKQTIVLERREATKCRDCRSCHRGSDEPGVVVANRLG